MRPYRRPTGRIIGLMPPPHSPPTRGGEWGGRNEGMKGILAELLYSLADAVEHGDVWGHLTAWAEMAVGAINAEDRIYTVGGSDGE